MAALVRKPNPDSIVALIIAAIIVWCISTCNSGCSFREPLIMTYINAKLIDIEIHHHYEAEDDFYLVFEDSNKVKRYVFVRNADNFVIGATYPITPNR